MAIPVRVEHVVARLNLRERVAQRRATELNDPPLRFRQGRLEVDQWVVSHIVLRKIVPAVGVHPFPLNELMLMTSAVAWFQPTHVYEWGTNIGKSARVFYEAARALRLDATVHSIDLPDDAEHGEHPGADRGRLVRGLPNVVLSQGDGLDTALDLHRRHAPRSALFFIDGDHSAASVGRELEGVLDAAPEAAVLLHDTFWQTPESGYNVAPAEALSRVLASRPDYLSFSPDLGLPGMTLVWRDAAAGTG